MGFLKEFKEFALKGNVMDMAVGVLIGSAFTGIVTALTTDFINPLITIVGGTEIGGKLKIGEHMVKEVVDGIETSTLTPIYLEWGHFITAVINFLIMAIVLFCLVKFMNKLASLGKKKKDEEAPAAPAEPSDEVKLLTDIKEILANQNK